MSGDLISGVKTFRQFVLGQLYPCEVKMLMRPGGHTVAVGLYDEQGGTASYVVEGVELAAP